MDNPFSINQENKKIFINDTSKNKDIDSFSTLSGEFLKLEINKGIKLIFLAVLFFFILFIFLRLFFLQIIDGDRYLRMAQGNEVRIEKIVANRGIIYDRYMQSLVKNISLSSLHFNAQIFPDQSEKKEEILEKLGGIIGKEHLSAINFDEKDKTVLIKNNLSAQERILFEVEKDNLPGFFLETRNSRQYIRGKEFSHLLGYTGRISQEDLAKGYLPIEESGKTGIERYYEDWLRGQPGQKRVERNISGEQTIVAIEPPGKGKSIILSIDSELQKILALSLEKWTKAYNGRAGAAIILSPKNGEVLALVSYPFFDNNLFSQGISATDYQKIISDPRTPLFFRAISGEYLPGSTIKPIIGLAALEEGLIDEKTTFISTGGLQAGQRFFADWRWGGHGLTNLKKALADSVNTFFYFISGQSEKFYGLGPDKIALYFKNFGFGKETGIDLLNEAKGFVPTPNWKKQTENESWFLGDSYNLGIGHGYLRTTPLQIALFTATIANEGKVVQPRIIKEIIGSEINKDNNENYSWQLPFKEENFKIIKNGLKEAVVSGTAIHLSYLPVQVAGKTGTSQVGVNRFNSLFTGFAPFDDPEIVITVVVEDGGEGSGAATRTTRETLEWWYDNRYNTSFDH